MAQRPLPKRLKTVVSDYLQTLKADGLPIQRAFIFGSFAKGAPHRWSDVDVCVVSPRFGDTWEAMQYLWSKRKLDLRYTIEPIGFNPKDFRENTSLAREIKKYGIEVKV